MYPLLILYFVAVLVSSLGFIKFTWFLSLGYAFSIVGMALTNLILFRKNLTVASVILNLLCIVSGARLGTFLFIRERTSAAYIDNVRKEKGADKERTFFTKVMIWLPCAFIYACEVSPVMYRLYNAVADNIYAYIGIVVCCLGIFFEAVGDHQKSVAKKRDPNRYVDTGLYRYVRCPNYFGEILFWTGVFISGITAYHSIAQWIVAIFGYVCIAGVMVSAASGLEKRQRRNYGNDERYKAYCATTPILIPFLPIYSIAK